MGNSAYTDRELVRLITTDLEKGFRALMAQYKESVYWHIRRIVNSHNEADDITQETFIRVFRSINRFEFRSSLATWIYRIATNEALRYVNSHKNNTSIDSSQINIIDNDGMRYDAEEIQIELQKAIQTLPERQKMVFSLRYYEELGYDEIAEITNSNTQTAKANYSLAKKKITDYLKLKF